MAKFVYCPLLTSASRSANWCVRKWVYLTGMDKVLWPVMAFFTYPDLPLVLSPFNGGCHFVILFLES
jgi:hypothetical protein